MADEDGRARDPPKGADDAVDVALVGVEAVLAGDDLVPLGLKWGDQLVKQEPSAQSPWANTMLGLVCEDMVLPSCGAGGITRDPGSRSADSLESADWFSLAGGGRECVA